MPGTSWIPKDFCVNATTRLGLLGLGVYKLGIEPMMARERERRFESESDDD